MTPVLSYNLNIPFVLSCVLALNLLGFIVHILYFARTNKFSHTCFCLFFILFFAWLVWFAPLGFLNYVPLDSGLILLTILIGLELFFNPYPNKKTILKWCFLIFVFEILKFGIFNVCLDFIISNCFWIIYVGALFCFVGYFWVLNHLIKYTVTVFKSKGYLWLFFGLRRHKLKIFFRYIRLTRKSSPYSFICLIEDFVFVPISIVACIRTFCVPLVGIFLTYNIVVCQNTTSFWLFFIYVLLLTSVVNNSEFQKHAKLNYSPLIFKAGLWNVLPVVCAWCGGLGLTAIGIGIADSSLTDYNNKTTFQKDVDFFKINHKSWTEDRVTTSVQAAEPVRPQWSDPKYQTKSISEHGLNTTITVIK